MANSGSPKYFRIRYHELEEKLIPLPFGLPLQKGDSVVSVNKTSILWKRPQKKINIQDRNKLITIPEQHVTVYPYYHKTFTLKDDRTLLTVEPIFCPEELGECNRILRNRHYLPLPPSGMYIAGKIGNEIVGTLVLSRLPPHMRPCQRRKLEDEREEIFIEGLWIRRIAVDGKFSRKGVGTSLAIAAIDIAKDFWLPKPHIIELISEIKNHDFLTNAGYERHLVTRKKYLKETSQTAPELKKHTDTYYYYYEFQREKVVPEILSGKSE
jgi:GNAT superfamily N-acetyltransferase